MQTILTKPILTHVVTYSGVCVSVCLFVGYKSEWTMQKRQNRSRIQDAIPFGGDRLSYVLSGVQMGATLRVWLNDNDLYCH